MSAINTKSTKSVILAAYNDLARELELTKRQLADAMTEKGVLLNQLAIVRQESEHFEVEAGQALQALEAANQVRAELQDERDALIVENEQLITILSKQPQVTAPVAKPAPRMTVAATVVESQAPVIQITDHDKAVYAKFQALPREQKQAYYDFAHSNGFGHLGIHNVNAVRVAFLAAKAA